MAALADWIAVHRGLPRLEAVAKPSVMLGLIAWVLTLADPDPTTLPWVVAALGLSLAGDVFLLPQLDLFIAGLSAFLLGHLAYIPGLLTRADPGTASVVGAVLLVGAVIVGSRIARAAAAKHGAGLGGAVAVYVLAVGATAVLAIATRQPLIAVGGALFATSDGILGWNRFVAPVPHGRTAVHVTYHLAQGCLATLAVNGTL